MIAQPIRNKISVKGVEISIITRPQEDDFISLTDIARYKNSVAPADVIKNWLRRKDTIEYLGLWEKLNNPDFKLVEFDQFKNAAGSNAFTLSPKQWIESTNAIGIRSSSGRYGGGTLAHYDLAMEFASWISAEFRLYINKEFQRLKQSESYRHDIEWNVRRELAKATYSLQTDTIKDCLILPELTKRQINHVYASEADVLNVALFGMTAREWRKQNPKLAKKGNIRDYTDLLHLVILNNLENINAELIGMKLSQRERLIKLNKMAKRQMEILCKNKPFNKLQADTLKIN